MQAYPKYKEPSLPDLSFIPAHWEEKRMKLSFTEIDECSATGDEEMLSVSHITGITPRSQKNVNMFVAESNVGLKICSPGDIVINTMWAWMAALGVSKYHGIVSPSYGVYRPKGQNYNQDYLDFLLRTEIYRAEYVRRSTGINTSRLRLYPDRFLDMRFICPPREEQDQIVRFLDWKVSQINRLINNKKNHVALLKEQRRVLINTVVTRGGDGWQTLRIKDVAEIIGGTTPKSGIADYWDGDINWVTPTDINKKHIFESERKITEKAVKDCSLRVIPKGAVLFTSRAPIGKVALAETDMYCNQGFKNLLCNNNIKSHFLFYWLLANEEYLNALGSGSTFKEISKATFSNVIIQVPGIDSQQQIITQLDEDCLKIDRIADKISIEIILLNEYRTCLISDVVTGKMDVRNIIVPEYEKIKDVSLDDDEEIDNEAINEVAE